MVGCVHHLGNGSAAHMARDNSRVTLQDIAKATGFTVNTVSRALKNKEDISRDTCLHIQNVAREMGYVRNYIASSLRSGRTKTIAMIAGSMMNPFYAVLGDLIQQQPDTGAVAVGMVQVPIQPVRALSAQDADIIEPAEPRERVKAPVPQGVQPFGRHILDGNGRIVW